MDKQTLTLISEINKKIAALDKKIVEIISAIATLSTEVDALESALAEIM